MVVNGRGLRKHFEDCIAYPVSCSFCSQGVPRSKLKIHQASECLTRPVECSRCFTPLIASELQNHMLHCQFMQPIYLSKSCNSDSEVCLAPQLKATGPVYQEQGGDTSTIYIASSGARLKEKLRSQDGLLFATNMDLIISERDYKIRDGRSGNVGCLGWYICKIPNFQQKIKSPPVNKIDVINTRQDIIASFEDASSAHITTQNGYCCPHIKHQKLVKLYNIDDAIIFIRLREM